MTPRITARGAWLRIAAGPAAVSCFALGAALATTCVSRDIEHGRETVSAPFVSKTDAALDFLLSVRGREDAPEDLKPILQRDLVSVSIRFAHELDKSEIKRLEARGLQFRTIPGGGLARSGAIYGVESPWALIPELAALESVVRIESAWQPGLRDAGARPEAHQRRGVQ